MNAIQLGYKRIIEGETLSSQDAYEVMSAIMDGEATPAQIGFLTGVLRMRGETPSELAGFAKAMRAHAVTISIKSANAIDTCGTGGDAIKTFNISTASAFVAAAAGVPVAKHGNRAYTSKCGSADVLEALGVNLEKEPAQIADSIDTIGIGFIFAPMVHPAMKYAGPARKEIGVRTFFNLLGPLTNPAGAKRQVMGVWSAELTTLIAEVLLELGAEKAIVAHGLDGLDEISPIGSTRLAMVESGRIFEEIIQPEDLGIPRVNQMEILAGNNSMENAEMLRKAVSPEPSPLQTAILPNSAAALWVADKAKTLKDAAILAEEIIRSGSALIKLDEYVKYSQ